MLAENKIIKLHDDPAEWEIAIDLDVPRRKQNRQDVQALMESIAELIEQRVLTDSLVKMKADKLGVKIVGLRIEDC